MTLIRSIRQAIDVLRAQGYEAQDSGDALAILRQAIEDCIHAGCLARAWSNGACMTHQSEVTA